MSAATTATVHPALRARHGLSEQARQILARRLYAVVATENDDGTVHLVPVMFLFDNGRVLIESGAGTRKARNVAARPRASVLVQTPEATWALGGGPATIVRGEDASALNQRIRGKYLTADGERACGDLLAELDDITIVVVPTQWLSWDISVIMQTLAERGVDLGQAETWFRSDG